MHRSDTRIPLYDGVTHQVLNLPVIQKSDEEWRRILSPKSYWVTRQQGTEYAFSGAYHEFHDPGFYTCICCSTYLFSSDDKFDSGTGWASFSKAISDLNIVCIHDSSHSMDRTEVRCARCGAHLGHRFEDGLVPSGLRYCINSLALRFIPKHP